VKDRVGRVQGREDDGQHAGIDRLRSAEVVNVDSIVGHHFRRDLTFALPQSEGTLVEDRCCATGNDGVATAQRRCPPRPTISCRTGARQTLLTSRSSIESQKFSARCLARTQGRLSKRSPEQREGRPRYFTTLSTAPELNRQALPQTLFASSSPRGALKPSPGPNWQSMETSAEALGGYRP
jgi:hypothetical protein